MLLGNLEPPKLCNGMRLVVKKLLKHVIEVTIIPGYSMGDALFLPRVPLTPPGAEIQFALRRLQLPLRVSFAISINKSQRQTLSIADLYLGEPCFSHGELYVDSS